MAYPAAILNLSPVFFLQLDETGGSTADDASPNGHDGTYSGVLLDQAPAHQHGRSVEFSSGDTVFLGTLPTVSASWSVSFWMRHPATDGNYHTIIAKRDSWSSSGTKFGVWIHSSGDRLEIGNGASILGFASWNPPEDNVWRHIVVVNDTVAGQRRLYVDKVLVQETTGALSDTGGASAGVSIGKNHYDASFPDPFVGGLDDMALFDGVLTQTDVDAIYDEATTAGGGAALLKLISETSQASEGSLRLRELNRVAEETLQLAETRLRALGLTRLRAETVQSSESTAFARGFVRVVSETIQLAESIARSTLALILQIVSETLHVSEAVLRPRVLRRILSENIQTTESRLRLREMVRVLSETQRIEEAIVKAREMIRRLAEEMRTAESTTPARSMVRIANEALQIAEALVRSVITPGIDALVAALVRVVPALGGSPSAEPSLHGSIEVDP